MTGNLSLIPCNLCGDKVTEFSIPNDIWNKVIRLDGKEHDKEYLCKNCWSKALRDTLEVGVSDKLTFAELRKANVTRCIESFHLIEDRSPFEWMTCVLGELGEAANKLKKVKRDDGTATIENVLEELADVAIYLDLLFVALDGSMEDEIIKKFNATSEKVGSRIFIGLKSDEEIKWVVNVDGRLDSLYRMAGIDLIE